MSARPSFMGLPLDVRFIIYSYCTDEDNTGWVSASTVWSAHSPFVHDVGFMPMTRGKVCKATRPDDLPRIVFDLCNGYGAFSQVPTLSLLWVSKQVRVDVLSWLSTYAAFNVIQLGDKGTSFTFGNIPNEYIMGTLLSAMSKVYITVCLRKLEQLRKLVSRTHLSSDLRHSGLQLTEIRVEVGKAWVEEELQLVWQTVKEALCNLMASTNRKLLRLIICQVSHDRKPVPVSWVELENSLALESTTGKEDSNLTTSTGITEKWDGLSGSSAINVVAPPSENAIKYDFDLPIQARHTPEEITEVGDAWVHALMEQATEKQDGTGH